MAVIVQEHAIKLSEWISLSFCMWLLLLRPNDINNPSFEADTTPVSTTTPSNQDYTMVWSGSTCERVTSKAECEEAASQLGLSDTTASVETTGGYPPYCYLFYGDDLYFNNDGNSRTECSSRDPCICKWKTGKVNCYKHYILWRIYHLQ